MNGADCVVFDGEEYPVTVVFSDKRHSIGLTVKPTGEVVLRVPQGHPREEGIAFARSKAAWIAKHVERFRSREVLHRHYAEGEVISFFGEEYTIRRTSGKYVKAAFSGAELLLTVPEDFSAEEAEDACRSAVIYLFRREGTAKLKPLAEKYAALCGTAAPPVRVRVQERKWGCCTPKNGIIINVHVLLAPVFVIEYLIVHEVAHLQHRNHQQEFWNEVERLMPEYRRAEALLKSDGWKWVF